MIKLKLPLQEYEKFFKSNRLNFGQIANPLLDKNMKIIIFYK